jgi:hypothetical protein
VNKQTGQWGTQYSPSQDLGRAPMMIDTVNTPVEKFTIFNPFGGRASRRAGNGMGRDAMDSANRRSMMRPTPLEQIPEIPV